MTSETASGARIIPGIGSVIASGPLTVVTGGDSAVGFAALAMVDELAAASRWTFEGVAAALHDFVVSANPPGVAAVLDVEGEPIVFAFDQAEAVAGDIRAKGDGRAGWTTEVVGAFEVELRLASVPYTSKGDDTVLRNGMVPGAGAIVAVDASKVSGILPIGSGLDAPLPVDIGAAPAVDTPAPPPPADVATPEVVTTPADIELPDPVDAGDATVDAALPPLGAMESDAASLGDAPSVDVPSVDVPSFDDAVAPPPVTTSFEAPPSPSDGAVPPPPPAGETSPAFASADEAVAPPPATPPSATPPSATPPPAAIAPPPASGFAPPPPAPATSTDVPPPAWAPPAADAPAPAAEGFAPPPAEPASGGFPPPPADSMAPPPPPRPADGFAPPPAAPAPGGFPPPTADGFAPPPAAPAPGGFPPPPASSVPPPATTSGDAFGAPPPPPPQGFDAPPNLANTSDLTDPSILDASLDDVVEMPSESNVDAVLSDSPLDEVTDRMEPLTPPPSATPPAPPPGAAPPPPPPSATPPD